METQPLLESPSPLRVAPAPPAAASTDWTRTLPVLTSGGVTLRELRLSDAASLHAMLATNEVTRFISPPPTTVDGFERFILWTHRERAMGRYLCFGVVPEGSDYAVGLIQVRQLEPGFVTAEWGFAVGQPYWGSGLFEKSARQVLPFVFDALHVQRLEARAVVLNDRGNGALRKIGARQEGVLRKSFLRQGEHLDQHLWAIVAEDWRMLQRHIEGPIH